MENLSPTITRTETADGWTVTSDYGKQGISSAVVHIAQGTPTEAAANRRGLERTLNRFGYKITEIT